MQRLKALDELTPADLWREAPKGDDEFWRDARQKPLSLVKAMLAGVQVVEDCIPKLGRETPAPIYTQLVTLPR